MNFCVNSNFVIKELEFEGGPSWNNKDNESVYICALSSFCEISWYICAEFKTITTEQTAWLHISVWILLSDCGYQHFFTCGHFYFQTSSYL